MTRSKYSLDFKITTPESTAHELELKFSDTSSGYFKVSFWYDIDNAAGEIVVFLDDYNGVDPEVTLATRAMVFDFDAWYHIDIITELSASNRRYVIMLKNQQMIDITRTILHNTTIGITINSIYYDVTTYAMQLQKF